MRGVSLVGVSQSEVGIINSNSNSNHTNLSCRYSRTSGLSVASRGCSSSVASPKGANMSYYSNGPRIFTPSILKTTKTSAPLESVRFDHPESALAVNTSHKSRGANLQYTYPSASAPTTASEECLRPCLRTSQPARCPAPISSILPLMPHRDLCHLAQSRGGSGCCRIITCEPAVRSRWALFIAGPWASGRRKDRSNSDLLHTLPGP